MKYDLKPLGNSLPASIFSSLYNVGVTLRNLWFENCKNLRYDPPVPTISIGGVHAGGTGKTPLTAYVADYLCRLRGFEVAILSRGYGRAYSGQRIIAPFQSASWVEVGDEPEMIHTSLPQTWLGIGPDRCSSARQILKRVNSNLPNLAFVLDDGFQHRRIGRNLDIVCLPAMNERPSLIPAGYLREPFKNLKRADLVCIIGSQNDLEQIKWTQRYVRSQLGSDLPLFTLLSKPAQWVNFGTGETRQRLNDGKWGLVSGIARPHRFVQTVNSMGISPACTYLFPDHYIFSKKEIERISEENIDGIITTEKDASRMRTLKLVNSKEIWYLKISLDFSDQVAYSNFSKKIDSILSFSHNRRNPS